MPLKVVKRPDTGALTITGTVKLPTGARLRIRQRAQSDRRPLAEEEAVALEAELLREAWHGEKRGSRSFAAAVTSYLTSAPRSPVDVVYLRRILLAFGNVPLSSIDQEAINRAKAKMYGGRDIKPSTLIRSLITPVRSVMKHAARLKWCEPPQFELPRQPQGRTLYLLPAEVEKLLAAAAPHLRPLLVFLAGTGARVSEATGLDWRDVDLVGARAIF
jgi:integrase